MWMRILFAFLALTAIVLLFSARPAGFDEAEKERRLLLLAGMLVVGAGMALPLGRAWAARSPGRTLGFVSKLLGWAGVGALPAAVALGLWALVPVCVLLPVAAIALWKEKAWAAWPWYAVAVGCFMASAALAVQAVTGGSAANTTFGQGQSAGRILGISLYAGVGVTLVREIGAWRRNRRDPGAEPGGSSS